MTTSRVVVDLQEILYSGKYPPAPILWLTCVLDTVFLGLNWRRLLFFFVSSEWLNVRVPSINSACPPVLSYAEFRLQHQQEQDGSIQQQLALIYRFIFETSSTSIGVLTTPTAILTLILLVCCIQRLKRLVLPIFQEIGRRAASEQQQQDRITKFGEYLFRLFYHSLVSAYGLWQFGRQPWWTRTELLYSGVPHHAITPGMAVYYLIQAAYNLDALYSLLKMSFEIKWRTTTTTTNESQQQQQQSTVLSLSSSLLSLSKLKSLLLQQLLPFSIGWSRTARGDFSEMFLHHLVANALVIGSSHCRLTRIGSMVLLLHDVSDIPVDLAKICHFVKYKIATMVCFAIMVLVWMVTRLYLLPVTVFGSVLTQNHLILESPTVSPLLYICYRHPFYLLLTVLIGLHVAWFGMFLKIAHTMITKNENHDYSEHKQGESSVGAEPETSDSSVGSQDTTNKKDD